MTVRIPTVSTPSTPSVATNLAAPNYDRLLSALTLGLLILGWIMITSATMPLGERLQQDAFFYSKRTLLYSGLALPLFLIVLQLPIRFWQRCGASLLLLSISLLLLVLLISPSINGAARWIAIGPLRLQPAELTKLALPCYLAGYVVRKAQALRQRFWDFCKPLAVMLLLALLLLAQPDLGSVIVLFITSLVLLFLAGAQVWQLLAVVASGVLAAGLLIITAPYRLRRVTAFLDPWQDPYGSGYQLTQSLMAFGRGSYWGQGLGNGVQKLEYLPAAHTDFIFAIIAEELGFSGALVVFGLLGLLVARGLWIGRQAWQAGQLYAGFLACAFAVWWSLQIIINIGATVGTLPTKGLTLPLISYGGSNLLVMLLSVAMVLRIDFERRCAQNQGRTGERYGS
ncbi:MAG: cell division protein FtsW [Candidatus Symbiodolus clandestinus]